MLRGTQEYWTEEALVKTLTEAKEVAASSASNRPANHKADCPCRVCSGHLYCVAHSCDNPTCVNPRHLSIGTNLDNARDRTAKGRGYVPPFKTRADDPPEKLRLRELADRLLKSCVRAPVSVEAQRWKDWRRGRRDLSFDMIDHALLRGGKRAYARAIYLQKAADLIEADADVPALPDIQHRAVEADCASDRAREMAAIDGMTDEERKTLEVALTEESGVIDLFLERLRRDKNIGEMRIGRVHWAVLPVLVGVGVALLVVAVLVIGSAR